ncbi:MAG TPA: Flp family type IVb pilin [Acidimicrobiia bacterium]|nr:Flp family type IVb pilin [Acidimicrobiia bacterium]
MFVWFYRITTDLRDDRGAALVEWSLLVVVIALVALLGVTAAGQTVSETYGDIANELVNAGS